MRISPVLFSVVAARRRSIGIVRLNAEKTLNSLSLPMIDLISSQLEAWRDDDDIALVVFEGAGDRAFCAGGDIQALYQSMRERTPYAEEFFEREYRLDFSLHTYPKPRLVWGHGVVMGGGLGILGACSHRIGTETARMALPEITIGLFPDAGATWLLAQMPTHLAHFLAWTGSQLNAQDARRVGWINHLVPFAARSQVHEALAATAWSPLAAENHSTLSKLLAGFESTAGFPASVVEQHEDEISRMVGEALGSPRPELAFAGALARLSNSDKWLARAAANFSGGCPTTARIVTRQIREGAGLGLKQMFMLEFVIALQCSLHPDFAEGVRALLVDKDNQPDWQYKQLADVPDQWIDEHFTMPGGRQNPLRDLPDAGRY